MTAPCVAPCVGLANALGAQVCVPRLPRSRQELHAGQLLDLLIMNYGLDCTVRKSQWFVGFSRDLGQDLGALVNQWSGWFAQRAPKLG